MKNALIILVSFLISNTSYSFQNLSNGVGLSDEAVEAQLYNTSTPYAIARQGQRSISKRSIQAYIDTGVSVYSVSSGLDLVETKSSDRTVLGHWQLLESYPQTVMQGEILKAAKFMSDMTSNYWEVQQISAPKTGLNVVSNARDYFPTDKQYGCLSLLPLRYGAITTNDSKDLLVLTGPNLFIFSTLLNKVVFSENWVASDEVSAEAMTSLKANLDSENLSYLYYEYAQFGEAAPQYIAQSGDDFKVKRLYPAWRSFAKLFFDDFNNDNKPDIIMWRKLYESRLTSDSVEGFITKGELSVHYSFIDGVYTIQETPPEKIQTWLTEKNLTWQKGYPSKSECAGQEGQLILEMHDPLLNDPEVLH